MSWIPRAKWRWIGWGLLFIFVAPGLVSCVSMAMNNDRRNDSAGIAPDPQVTQAAVLQVYAAGVYGWRGLVADHTWIAAKPSEASDYTVYQVIGWPATFLIDRMGVLRWMRYGPIREDDPDFLDALEDVIS